MALGGALAAMAAPALALPALGAPVPAAPPVPDAPVFVGAIRWDAWYRREGLTVFPQDSLAPTAFSGRAPVHCVSDAAGLDCTGDQAVLDAEIRAAVRAGLDFWAFDWSAADSPFHRAFDLYQSSSLVGLIRWCPIAGLGDLGSPDHSLAPMEAKATAWAALMAQPSFFATTIDGQRRPLFFILYHEDEMRGHFGSLEAMRAGLGRLRAAAARAGAGDPYLVLLDGSLDRTLFQASGADALSSYIARFDSVPDGSYAALDTQVRAFWEAMRATGAPMVPIAQVGWDARPRIRKPMPWDAPVVLAPGQAPGYYAIGTPEAFADQVVAATRFVRDHAEACPSRLVLAYSWDECDEGGCILPTRGDPSGRYVTALGRALGR